MSVGPLTPTIGPNLYKTQILNSLRTLSQLLPSLLNLKY